MVSRNAVATTLLALASAALLFGGSAAQGVTVAASIDTCPNADWQVRLADFVDQ